MSKKTMHIDRDWKRLIRIEGTPKNPRDLSITDAETGIPITNVIRVTVRLGDKTGNVCEITYEDTNKINNIVEETLIVNDFELNIRLKHEH